MPGQLLAMPAWLSQELCEADMANEERWLAGMSLQSAQTALRTAEEGEQQARERFESHQCSYVELRAAVRRTLELEQAMASCAADLDLTRRRHRGERASYVRRIGARTAELVLRGPIGIGGGRGSLWFYRLVDELYRADQQCGGVERIAVNINSPGGSLSGGLSLFEALLDHTAHVEVSIEGTAESAAALVALAGDTIRIGSSTRFMLHSGRLVPRDLDVTLTHAEVIRACGNLASENRQIRAILSSRTRLTPAQIDEVMIRDVWFDAQQALAAGLAHEIIEPEAAAAP